LPSLLPPSSLPPPSSSSELQFRPTTRRFCSSRQSNSNAAEIAAIEVLMRLHAPPCTAASSGSHPLSAARDGASSIIFCADQLRLNHLLELFLDLWLLFQSEHLEFLGFLPLWLLSRPIRVCRLQAIRCLNPLFIPTTSMCFYPLTSWMAQITRHGHPISNFGSRVKDMKIISPRV